MDERSRDSDEPESVFDEDGQPAERVEGQSTKPGKREIPGCARLGSGSPCGFSKACNTIYVENLTSRTVTVVVAGGNNRSHYHWRKTLVLAPREKKPLGCGCSDRDSRVHNWFRIVSCR